MTSQGLGSDVTLSNTMASAPYYPSFDVPSLGGKMRVMNQPQGESIIRFIAQIEQCIHETLWAKILHSVEC